MDFQESTRIVFDRVQKLEPENVRKIIGYLLIQDQCDKEMIRLALGPDKLIQDVIHKAKTELQQLALTSSSPPISPSMNQAPSDHPMRFSPLNSVAFQNVPSPFRVPSPYWGRQAVTKHQSDYMPLGYPDSISEVPNEARFLGLDDQMEQLNLGLTDFSHECYFPDTALGNFSPRTNHHHHMSMPEFPVKTCHYFNKGYCKHGNNWSLEKLELEIIEILKSRRGNPLSIASLPMIYYEKYGKVLQAEGYLTESQRHGKAGHSLTRLLSRLGSICLIDRPHGQHAVILAEDAAKFMECRHEKSDPSLVHSKSRQIYLTFPAESTFTEEDVSNYFNTFGPVEDVRIPCQHKRMFGFVTFVNSDTVQMILAKGNPHFVCGARVLVKPYKEKSKLVDRKYHEGYESPFHHMSHYSAMDSRLHSMPRGCRGSKFLQNHIMEDNDQALEFERMRLTKLQLTRKLPGNQAHIVNSVDRLNISEDRLAFSSSECLHYLMDVLNNGSIVGDKSRPSETNYDQDSQGLHLPESPFAAHIANSISTLI
ncbi:zinc finger CCCH domain-containing protein 18-like isoform X2 [Rhodamnia argentea]|uniref:Zinc finger CCCH domain-containing protein 18-like isoform X2 n=1 Tax=Rhodamnia argentea TaxID=178133 RepID=A0ABM3H0Z7_9MYRT|nr:zinc finger CCCH domain-containing protein 18-like isoform X2 [Rhodamnia argentea]